MGLGLYVAQGGLVTAGVSLAISSYYAISALPAIARGESFREKESEPVEGRLRSDLVWMGASLGVALVGITATVGGLIYEAQSAQGPEPASAIVREAPDLTDRLELPVLD